MSARSAAFPVAKRLKDKIFLSITCAVKSLRGFPAAKHGSRRRGDTHVDGTFNGQPRRGRQSDGEASVKHGPARV